MPYIDLANITLKSDYVPKELDIISFNSVILKIETFLNQLNENVKYNKSTSNGIPIGTELPTEYVGQFFLKEGD